MENYHILGRIGEGAHGIVYKAKRIQSGDLVALKKVPLRNLEDGFPTEVRTTFLFGSRLIIIYQLFKKIICVNFLTSFAFKIVRVLVHFGDNLGQFTTFPKRSSGNTVRNAHYKI